MSMTLYTLLETWQEVNRLLFSEGDIPSISKNTFISNSVCEGENEMYKLVVNMPKYQA